MCAYYVDRVYAIIKQAVTFMGKLLFRKLNLQNISIISCHRKEFGKSFVPNDNKVFICVDYFQGDLKVLKRIFC